MSPGAVSSPAVRPHSPLARLGLSALGFIFMLGGWGCGWALLRAAAPVGATGQVWVLVLALVLLWAVGAYGAWLLVRGLRGWSRRGALDRASPSLREGLRRLGPLPWMALGALVWVATGGHAPAHAVPAVLWSLAVSTLGLPLWVGIHEFGHLVPGLAQGRALVELRLWPVRVERSPNGGLQASPCWRPRDGLLGCVLWEAGNREPGRGADRVMLLGGVVANGVAAVGLTLAAQAWDPGAREVGLPAFLLAGALFNGTLAIGNLLPLRLPSGVTFDGARFLQTFHRTYPATRLKDRLLAMSLRRRPRDWGLTSTELVGQETRDDDDRAWLLLLGVSVALDRGEWIEAERLLQRQDSLRRAPGLVLRELSLQRVLVRSLLASDAVTARIELAACPRPPSEDGYDDLARSAVLLAEGSLAGAAEALDRWKRGAAAHPSWTAGNQWALERLDSALSSS